MREQIFLDWFIKSWIFFLTDTLWNSEPDSFAIGTLKDKQAGIALYIKIKTEGDLIYCNYMVDLLYALTYEI